MAIAISLDDPHFSFDWSFSLLIFYVKRKNEENWLEVNFFAKCTIEFCQFFLALRLSVRRISNAYWRVKFCKNFVNIKNYLRNRPTSTKYD